MNPAHKLILNTLVANTCSYYAEATGMDFKELNTDDNRDKCLQVLKEAVNRMLTLGWKIFPLRTITAAYTDVDFQLLPEYLRPPIIKIHSIVASARRITIDDKISAEMFCDAWASSLKDKNDILFLYLPVIPSKFISFTGVGAAGYSSLFTVLHAPRMVDVNLEI